MPSEGHRPGKHIIGPTDPSQTLKGSAGSWQAEKAGLGLRDNDAIRPNRLCNGLQSPSGKLLIFLNGLEGRQCKEWGRKRCWSIVEAPGHCQPFGMGQNCQPFGMGQSGRGAPGRITIRVVQNRPRLASTHRRRLQRQKQGQQGPVDGRLGRDRQQEGEQPCRVQPDDQRIMAGADFMPTLGQQASGVAP